MNHHAMPQSFRKAALSLLFSFPLALPLALGACSPQGSEAPANPPLEGADIGGSFELVDKHGETVRWSDFDGSYRVVYFGYTYCPDVCPTDVQRMMQGYREFAKLQPELADQIRPIFISVDPERDTPQVVGEFAAAFSDRLIGLTGTPEQVKAAADKFRVFYSHGEEMPGGGYLVNHSAIAYLFDKAGKPLATLPTDQGPEAVAAELAKWVN